jgi:hypothetical protein
MSDASATKVVALGSVDRWCPSGDRKISQPKPAIDIRVPRIRGRKVDLKTR